MIRLKQEIGQFLSEKFGPDHYSSLNDALIGLCSKGSISEEDRDILRKMSLDKDDK